MRSTSEIINLVYDHVKLSALAEAITGKTYKRVRPIGSLKEDIVINCLPTGDADVQDASINLNVYIPDLVSTIQSVKQSIPDTKRIEAIEAIIKSEFTDVTTQTYWFDIEFLAVMQETEIKQHFINARLKLRYINL